MKTNRFSLKARFRVGVGGWNCPCCGIAPRNRAKFARIHKRQVYRALDRELQKELVQE